MNEFVSYSIYIILNVIVIQIRNTYYLPFHEEIPRQGEERDHIPYYQWIPFILLGQVSILYFDLDLEFTLTWFLTLRFTFDVGTFHVFDLK